MIFFWDRKLALLYVCIAAAIESDKEGGQVHYYIQYTVRAMVYTIYSTYVRSYLLSLLQLHATYVRTRTYSYVYMSSLPTTAEQLRYRFELDLSKGIIVIISGKEVYTRSRSQLVEEEEERKGKQRRREQKRKNHGFADVTISDLFLSQHIL